MCIDVNSCQQRQALTAVIILVDPCILEVDGVILGLQNLRNKESLLRSKMQNDLSISLLSEHNLCSICWPDNLFVIKVRPAATARQIY